jgi:uncharacterized protein (DUF924 family)
VTPDRAAAATDDALEVLEFWWQAGPEKWFAGGEAFDDACRRFHHFIEAAAEGRLDAWAETPHAALALVIVTDQFPRNIFRGTERAFATDAKALSVATAAVERGFDRAFPVMARKFFYLPFMHVEDLTTQERGLDLYRALGDQDGYYYMLIHFDVIRRFGRFPHRNGILGRQTTPEEAAYLASGGFSA